MAAGLFVSLLLEGGLEKRHWRMSAFHSPLKKGNGSEVKYNRRFLGNPSYMITSGHYPSLEVRLFLSPLVWVVRLLGGN